MDLYVERQLTVVFRVDKFVVFLVDPGFDADKVRHKRRYRALQDGRVPPDDVLHQDIGTVVLINYW